MDLNLPGHPIHTRALSVVATHAEAGHLTVTGSILDLRKRGFCPVGSELQGMGIIHQMELRAEVDPSSGTVIELAAKQPTVAFEASAATAGESCRDPVGSLNTLRGIPFGEPFASALRAAAGGPLGCSHIVTVAQFVNATVPWMMRQECAEFGNAIRRSGELIFRRDLIFDGYQGAETDLGIGLQLSDLHTAPTPVLAPAPERFGSQYELRLDIRLAGWPATFTTVVGAQRRRLRRGFSDAQWEDLSGTLTALRGVSLGKGSAAMIARALDEAPPIRDALQMLGPALIQCRASFPDKWLARAVETQGHPGLIAMADSCYMWRRGGALERAREEAETAAGAAVLPPQPGSR